MVVARTKARVGNLERQMIQPESGSRRSPFDKSSPALPDRKYARAGAAVIISVFCGQNGARPAARPTNAGGEELAAVVRRSGV